MSCRVASHSRYNDGTRIPNAFENAASTGASVVLDKWSASIRVRHLGHYPLVEDDSVRDKGSTVVNLRGSRKLRRTEVYAELLNVLSSKDKDMVYFYESYLPKFENAPVDGRLSRIIEPRTVRVGIKYHF